jgi:hypothetical protein
MVLICDPITLATAIPEASSLALLMRKPDDKRSTEVDNWVCAPAKFLCAMSEAIFVFSTEAGIAISNSLNSQTKTKL